MLYAVLIGCTLLLIICLGGGRRLLHLIALTAFLLTSVFVLTQLGLHLGSAF
jgi:hypothetical protein